MQKFLENVFIFWTFFKLLAHCGTFACSQKCDLACASEFYMAENYFVLFNWQNCFFNRNATLRLEIIKSLSLLEALKLVTLTLALEEFLLKQRFN